MSNSEFESASEEQFDVEAILGAKVTAKRKGKVYWKYLIRWAGYGSEADTWEPPEHFSSPEILREFWRLVGKHRVDINDPDLFSKGDEFMAPRVGPPDRRKRPRDQQKQRSPSATTTPARKRQRTDYTPVTRHREPETSPEIEIVEAGTTSARKPSHTRNKASPPPSSRKAPKVSARIARNDEFDDDGDQSIVESPRGGLHRLSRGRPSSPAVSQTGRPSSQRLSRDAEEAAPPPSNSRRPKRKRPSAYGSSRRHRQLSDEVVVVESDQEQPEVPDDESIEEYPPEPSVDTRFTTSQTVSAIAFGPPKSKRKRGQVEATVVADSPPKIYVFAGVQTVACSCDRCIALGQTPDSPAFVANGLLPEIPSDMAPGDEHRHLTSGEAVRASEPTEPSLPNPIRPGSTLLGATDNSFHSPLPSASRPIKTKSTAHKPLEYNWPQLRNDFNIAVSCDTIDKVVEEIKFRRFKRRAPTDDDDKQIREDLESYRTVAPRDSPEEVEEVDQDPPNMFDGTGAGDTSELAPTSPVVEDSLFSSPLRPNSPARAHPAQDHTSTLDNTTPRSAKAHNELSADNEHRTGMSTQIPVPSTDRDDVAVDSANAPIDESIVHPFEPSAPVLPTPVHRAPTPVAVSTSPNGTPHRKFVTKRRAGPGRDSAGAIVAGKAKARSSMLTFTKDGAMTVKGLYPVRAPSTSPQRAVAQSAEPMLDNPPLGDGHTVTTSRAQDSEPHKHAPIDAEKLFRQAGFDRRAADALSDFEEDAAVTFHIAKTKPTPSDGGARADVQQTRRPATQTTTAGAAATLAKSQRPDMAQVKRSTNSMFGALGVGTLSPAPETSRSSRSNSNFVIKLSEAVRIPVKLKDMYSVGSGTGSSILVQAAARARQGGPSGKYYSGQLAEDVLRTVRSAGHHARVVYDEDNVQRNPEENWQRFVDRLEANDVFLAMLGQSLYVFCASMNISVARNLNVHEQLLNRPGNVVVAQVTIIDERTYANVATRAG